MIEGSGSRAGSGSIALTSGSGRPKNMWIRIRNTADLYTVHCSSSGPWHSSRAPLLSQPAASSPATRPPLTTPCQTPAGKSDFSKLNKFLLKDFLPVQYFSLQTIALLFLSVGWNLVVAFFAWQFRGLVLPTSFFSDPHSGTWSKKILQIKRLLPPPDFLYHT